MTKFGKKAKISRNNETSTKMRCDLTLKLTNIIPIMAINSLKRKLL